MATQQNGIAQRDLRVDYFRGIALILVLVDHIEGINRISLLREWTPRSLGFSDAAEAFVFLSGYTFGLVYSRRMETHGFVTSFAKSVLRSGQVYIAYCLTFAAVFACSTVCALPAGPLSGSRSGFIIGLLDILLLSDPPYAFGILTFYVVVLPYAALTVWLLRRSPLVALALSFAVYVGAHTELPLYFQPASSMSRWRFDPFAWQLLYIVAAAIAMRRCPMFQAMWSKITVSGLASLAVMAGLLHVKASDFSNAPPLQVIAAILERWPSLSDKNHLGAFRIVHFLSIAWLFSLWCGPGNGGLARAASRWAIILGQHSLPVYSCGLFFTHLSPSLLRNLGHTPLAIVVVHADAVLISVFVAMVLHAKSRRGRRALDHEETTQSTLRA